MSEQQPGTEPVQRPPAAPAPKDQGSLWGGIGLAWAVMVGGEAVLFSAGLVAWVVPPVAIVVWAVVLLIQGRTRTGRGMLLGLASIVAVALLLVAACFGLLMSGGGLHFD
ncbi:hypothetical protein KK141_20075 [Dyella sp. LX-66]|uniref:hypothetical protein n=1 Tax=unclassified Dyella TaxID=2634549 RepID=UPI001BDFB12A|nr:MULTISPECIES: hypothetical protein [unclassified Dyella]MBT2118474.1 hypothetical protein [Dyella sp. LX-1]MBT2141854.1 hypothetical protein [Dyella sp. LX-66]